jgi:hypothetical protein
MGSDMSNSGSSAFSANYPNTDKYTFSNNNYNNKINMDDFIQDITRINKRIDEVESQINRVNNLNNLMITSPRENPGTSLGIRTARLNSI